MGFWMNGGAGFSFNNFKRSKSDQLHCLVTLQTGFDPLNDKGNRPASRNPTRLATHPFLNEVDQTSLIHSGGLLLPRGIADQNKN